MLKLSNIFKNYYVADMTVEALKGINLCFRKNEFVSILGPSGCGKTTLLNIIGGLDQYTCGDLVINGRSTKEFKDRDWDVYRNHRIGFIFQSYNLIPHQTVLGNVELALTIAGLSKNERIERAKKALDRVGLSNQYKKKPNQLSGGQCQRVAIARALVNEPEILLADEPTGALDTETSVQIMDLIKEISKEKLVIMVTHNPELAYKYSNRIVNLLDGEVKDDSNPFSEDDEASEINELREIENNKLAELSEEERKSSKREKAKMSIFTAFMLSARNLWTKFKRTLLVGFAGSIGIIGVSAVLAVSTGVHDYINSMQDDLLSGNPIQITKSGYDIGAITSAASIDQKASALEYGDWVNVRSIISYLVNNSQALMSLVYNNEFSEDYIDYLMSMPEDYCNAIALNYDLDLTPSIYTNFECGEDSEAQKSQNGKISLSAITQTYAEAISKIEDGKYKDYSGAITSLTSPMSQCVPNNDYILTQYDLVYGAMPQNDHECILVVNSDDAITDLILAQLGFLSESEFYKMVYASFEESGDENYSGYSDYYFDKLHIPFEEITTKTFTWYPNDTIYTPTTALVTASMNLLTAKSAYEALADLPNDDASKQAALLDFSTAMATFSTLSTSGFNYQYKAKNTWDDGIDLHVSGIVKAKEGVSYGCLSSGILYSENFAREVIKKNMDSYIVKYIEALRQIYEFSGKGEYADYASVQVEYNLDYYWETAAEGVFNSGVSTSSVYVGKAGALSAIASAYGFDLGAMMGGSSGPTLTLRALGGESLPESISIYPISFDEKDKVTDYLDAWNKLQNGDAVDLTFNTYDDNYENVTGTKTLLASDRLEIKYTDSVGLIIDLINTMIDIVTVALICFTALSLLVSCVMIAIITYVSVMERVKEIGVIRALGGRKKDVSHLFNAETFIIGLGAGILGVAITYVLQIFGNIIVNAVSDGAISAIANLQPLTALIMIGVSIILTCISGFIPSKSAAKKDPVVALRTE